MSTRPTFTLGVFQPDEVPVNGAGDNACQTWASRGCNTSVLVPQQHDVGGWDYRNKLAGLARVRSLAGVPDDSLVAVASDVCPDEPDENKADFSALVNEAASLKTAHPGVLLYQSVAGGKILGLEGGAPADADYRRLLAAYDIVATDIYPVTGWGRPDMLRWVYDAQVRLAALAPHAERWAILECSDQKLPWVKADRTIATTTEIYAMAFLALIGGAKGIVWFPQSIGVWSFDATTPDTAVALQQINEFAAKNADFLTHGTLNATIQHPHYRGEWTLGQQFLTITVDISASVPVIAYNTSAISAAGGTSPTPTPPPVATPTVTPTPTPPPVQPAVQPLPWVLYRDLHHRRWSVTLPPSKPGGPHRTAFISDPSLVAVIDRAVSQAR